MHSKPDKQLNSDDLHHRQINQKKTRAPVIICDGLQTPENLGSVLRIADAIGSKGIILLDNKIDLNHKKIAKLARSTNKHVPLQQISFAEFKQIKDQFKYLYALEITMQSSNAFTSNIEPCDAVLLGHESTGIRDEALALCNGAFHLPMFGQNSSMNISHALAVFLYEWYRQDFTKHDTEYNMEI